MCTPEHEMEAQLGMTLIKPCQAPNAAVSMLLALKDLAHVLDQEGQIDDETGEPINHDAALKSELVYRMAFGADRRKFDFVHEQYEAGEFGEVSDRVEDVLSDPEKATELAEAMLVDIMMAAAYAYAIASQNNGVEPATPVQVLQIATAQLMTDKGKESFAAAQEMTNKRIDEQIASMNGEQLSLEDASDEFAEWLDSLPETDEPDTQE